MRPGYRANQRIEIALGIGGLFLLVIGCFLVLRPFLSALLWGGVLAYSTWPLFVRVRERLGGRTICASLLMTLLLATAFVLPVVLVGHSAAEALGRLIDRIRNLLALGMPAAPDWLFDLPIVGSLVGDVWSQVATNTSSLFELLLPSLGTIRDVAIELGLGLGGGLLELTLSVVATFFLFRDGETIIAQARIVGERVAGHRTHHLIEVTGDTIRGVVYGIVGTAIVQAALAGIGFWIAGIQGALALAVITFFLALIPFGPPLIWAPLAIWLMVNGSTGTGIFLALYGFLVISGVDNFLRPYLISQSSNLSFLLVFFGVIGGAIAFGFLGIFLGPVLLAVGQVVLKDWLASPAVVPPRAAA